MRYYAEWLDGEYVLLNNVTRGYNHSAVMQRAIRFHALFGSTVVLSDAQMIDFRTPILTLFVDPDFRKFLKEQENFLALVAQPVQGPKDRAFSIAMKGIDRLRLQPNKPADSFEMAATRLGEPIFDQGHFDAGRYLDPGNSRKGRVGKVLREFPRYKDKLTGLLHAINYFAKSPTPTTTTPSAGVPEGYDKVLKAACKDQSLVSEKQADRIQEILRIQDEHIPEIDHGRRAAIRKILGTGKWHHETWKPENLRLYLDVVHAWNCAINRSVAPEGGTLYESDEDIPLSRYEQSVTDQIGWFRAGPMPSTGLSDHIRLFLSWDPLDASWGEILAITRETRETAEKLQATSKAQNTNERADALEEHASRIAECLVGMGVPMKEVSEFWWSIVKGLVAATDVFPSEFVDIAQEVVRDAPPARAALKRRLIVNTLRHGSSAIL